MSNNTFDLKRFALLIKRDLMQDWRKYALQATALLGIMLAFPLFYTYTQYDGLRLRNVEINYFLNNLNHNYVIQATILFIFAFLIYASTTMNPISSKRKRIDYLLLPCSSLEKYLSRIVIHILGFVVVFFVCLFVADLIRMTIFSVAYPSVGVKALDLGILTTSKMFSNTKIFVMVTTMYMSIVAFFTLGATFWQKNGAIKSTVTLLAIIFTLIGFTQLLYRFFMAGRNINPPQVTQNDEVGIVIVTACFGCLALFFWILGYFRFKETELTNRW